MVSKFVQPSYGVQSGSTYPTGIDAAIAVLAEQAAQLAVCAQDTPNMTVAMRAGRLFLADRTIVTVAAQNSAALTAPTVNPRNDIVYYDATTGTIGVAAGTEAVSPADPVVPTNKIPKARIRWAVGMTSITNSVIDDLSAHANFHVNFLAEMEEAAIENIYEEGNASSIALNSVAFGGYSWIAVGAAAGSAAYIVKARGKDTLWDVRSNPKNFNLESVAHNGTIFCAVGQSDGTDAYIVTSSDEGENWTERANPKAFQLNVVAWSPGLSLWVAGGVSDGTDAYLITSPDAVTWTERANPKALAINGMAWSPELGLWVGVGNAGADPDAYIITSPDGITWTERANPRNVTLYSVAWSPTLRLFCAVGESDGTDAYIVTSPNGVNWTEQANPGNTALLSICWTGRFFVSVGSASGPGGTSYIVTSVDAQTWISRGTATESTYSDNSVLREVAFGSLNGRRKRIVIVGPVNSGAGDAKILVSPYFR